MPSAQRGFTAWQAQRPLGQQTGGVPGAAGDTFPINGAPEPWFRDRLDASRAARIPSAEFPAGYLGTVRTRREDRLQVGGPQVRQTQRSYQRGIHVGARVDPQAYFWTPEFNPGVGLELEARGQKFAPQGEAHTHLVNDGKAGPVRGSQGLRAEPWKQQLVDPTKPRHDQRLTPGWR